MKLLYLYIGYMNRPLDYHEIPFSDDYNVHFDRRNKKLLIEKNPNPQPSIYGDNILDLKLIVGKNGCGKSTILDLLGLTAHDVRREFPQHENEYEPWQETAHDWFALYHLEDDLFALEGYNSKILLETEFSLKTHYSAAVQYDFQTNTLDTLTFLQEFRKKETGYKYINQAAYLSYRLEPDCSWYSRPRRHKYEQYDNSFPERFDISQFNFYGVEHFLYLAAKNAEDFRSLFDNNPSALKVQIHLERNEIDKRILKEKDLLAEAIYGAGGTFLSVPMPQFEKVLGRHGELNCKHSLIIRYLEELLVYALNGETAKNSNCFADINEAEDIKYIQCRDFLLDFMEHLTSVPANPDSYKNTIMHSYDLRLARQFCASLEQIPDQFFISGDRAEIYLKDCETNFLEELMKCYDANQENEEHEIDHRGFLSFNVENLSTGELAMIDLYAAILNGVKGWNQQKRNLILLLDEPDSRLHPEWSRLFLKRLIELLGTEPFSGYRFQIIIATHSPLLLSDVPKKDIICLQQSADGITIEKADHGFMSNLNDILLDSMFLSSPFGAFAEQYTNDIIQQISVLKKRLAEKTEQLSNSKKVFAKNAVQVLSLKNDASENAVQTLDLRKSPAENTVQTLDPEAQIKELRKKIEIIDEPYIRETLKHSLDSLNYYTKQPPIETRIAYLEKELEQLKAQKRNNK